MAWIESHQNLREHPKTIALCAEMGWDLDSAIGKLHRFWWWCLDYAPDGDLRKFNDYQIAFAAGVAAVDAKRFVEAMVTGGGKVVSGFIDRDPYFRVHDWWDYAGRFLKTRWKNYPEKYEAVRNAYAKNQPKEPPEAAPKETPKEDPKTTNQPNQPNQPNLTKPHQPPERARFDRMRQKLCESFKRPEADPWTCLEETTLFEVSRRPNAEIELAELLGFRAKEARFSPQSISTLLTNWSETLDRSRNGSRNMPDHRAERRAREHPEDIKPRILNK